MFLRILVHTVPEGIKVERDRTASLAQIIPQLLASLRQELVQADEDSSELMGKIDELNEKPMDIKPFLTAFNAFTYRDMDRRIKTDQKFLSFLFD